MSKTKEECILEAIHQHTGIKTRNYQHALIDLWMVFDPTPAGGIFIKAMEEYAKQQAIAFVEWVENHAMKYKNGWLYKHGEEKLISAEQLYNLFLQQSTTL